MKYPEYEKAFSPARLNKYLTACGGDTMAALTLYRHNIKLCQKCYGILNIFEVVLRNAINEHYKAFFADPDWSRHQLQPGGSTLLQVFPAKTIGLGQRAIFNELQTIKNFRNRIAHYEAICFDSTGTKSTVAARASYALVIKYIKFLGYQESHLYFGLDVLPDKIMKKIDSL